jgi:L-fuculose-phosphate aldolase
MIVKLVSQILTLPGLNKDMPIGIEIQSEDVARKSLVEYCHRIHQRGLVSACGGNASLRLDNGKILVTPSGFALDEVREADLALIDIEGALCSACENRPTSEWQLHLGVYAARPDIGAVVHTHSPAATSFAYCGHLIEPVNPESMACLHDLPIIPYYQYGSVELAEAVAVGIVDVDALLLAKHGVVAVGKKMRDALHLAELVEETALMNIYIKMIKGRN